MSKINELRTQRAKAWEKAQAFLTANRDERGILSDENVKIYEGLEQDIVNLGKEIDRQERLDAMEREMAAPVSTPITEKPENTKKPDTKVGRASDAYTKAFWTQVRAKDGVPYEVRNALSEGVDSEGGYLVPDEFENTLVSGMEEEGSIRSLAHVFTTSNGVHKIPVVRTKGTANWIDEGGSYGDSDDVFGQEQIDAHKVGTVIKVSEELLNDSAFDLEKYFQEEFARRIGAKEEEAFIVGDGNKKPTGILNATGGAEVGVTAASEKAITADEILDLYYSVKAPYYTCYATVSAEGGKEMTDAGMVVDDSTIDFTIRWCAQSAAITSTGYRVQFQDEPYDVLSVDHMNFKRKGIKLHCRKVRR